MTQDVFHIVGTTIGGTYEVEKAVAEGGFGVLYRAYHGAFRAPIALKCLKIPPSVVEKDHAELLERFRKEAEVMFRLSAAIPTVVRPLHVDAFTTEEGILVPYMVLEWLEGETLDSMIIRRARDGKPPIALKKLVEIMTPIGRALERAHRFPSEEGIVSISHCDLKPENVFLTDFHGETIAKILDFGIAKVRQATSQIIGRQSQTGELSAFSPCYAAPEQWLPKRFGAAGPWTDIWGLALTLVEALAGRQIMSNDFQAAIGSAIDEKRRPSPRNEGVKVSDAVEQVFEKALAVDPKNRHESIALFWDELEVAVGTERSTSAKRAKPTMESSIPPPEGYEEGSAGLPGLGVGTPGLLSLDAPDAPDALGGATEFDLDLPPALAMPGAGVRVSAGASHARGGQAAALQLDPEPAKSARDPASGPQPRIDLSRPETFPELMVPGGRPAPASDRRDETSSLRRRDGAGGVQKGVLLETPADMGMPLELEGASPNSRRGMASPAERDSASMRRDGGARPGGAGRDPALERTGSRARPAAMEGPLYGEPVRNDGARQPAYKAFVAPIVLILIGVAVAAVDGGQNQIGGVQLNWVAGGIAGIGILLGLFRLFSD